MGKVKISSIIKTAIVTAFTIATALIWKDVIVNFIHYYFPADKFLFYEFLVAVISTIVIVIVLYLILKTEEETESLYRRWKRRFRKRLKSQKKKRRRR